MVETCDETECGRDLEAQMPRPAKTPSYRYAPGDASSVFFQVGCSQVLKDLRSLVDVEFTYIGTNEATYTTDGSASNSFAAWITYSHLSASF